VVEDEDLKDELEMKDKEYEIIMDPGYFYPDNHIENQVEDSPISHRFADF